MDIDEAVEIFEDRPTKAEVVELCTRITINLLGIIGLYSIIYYSISTSLAVAIMSSIMSFLIVYNLILGGPYPGISDNK